MSNFEYCIPHFKSKIMVFFFYNIKFCKYRLNSKDIRKIWKKICWKKSICAVQQENIDKRRRVSKNLNYMGFWIKLRLDDSLYMIKFFVKVYMRSNNIKS